MAKSDLLKEAIADAKAVKETALANAKIALEEAFAPRIQSMLSTKLAEDEMYEDDDAEMFGTPGEDPSNEPFVDEALTLGDIPIDEPGLNALIGGGDIEGDVVDGDIEGDMAGIEGDVDSIEGDIGNIEGDIEVPGEPTADAIEDEEVFDVDEDLELESIIRELEEDLADDEWAAEEGLTTEASKYGKGKDDIPTAKRGKLNKASAEAEDEADYEKTEAAADFDINKIIESILEEDEADAIEDEEHAANLEKDAEDQLSDGYVPKVELDEAYSTIESLRYTINEVNLLNAKLLYTNKLFRNFELSENQKMTVIENFDRAGNTREVKLVFSTLAESFKMPLGKKRRIVKEGRASKSTTTTAPTTKRIINEGNELANRWKKLAGLLD